MRQWFTMKAEDDVGEIVIYDEIGKSFWDDEAVSAKGFLESLTALGDVGSITLRVNSPGGDVFDGVAIHNSLKQHKAKVTAHIDGLAASAASYIVMAADKIVMPANSFMLVHGASGFAMGNADDVRALAEDLDRIDQSMMATYSARSGMTVAKVKALMKEDRLMDAKEAKDLGLTDEVTKETKMAARYSLRLLPALAAQRLRAATVDAREETAAEPKTETQTETKTEQQQAQVIDIAAAERKGIEQHRKYVDAVTDLCTLAAAPERVGNYVRAGTGVDQVRKELLEMRASTTIISQHQQASTVSPAAAWNKITDKLNSRARPGPERRS